MKKICIAGLVSTSLCVSAHFATKETIKTKKPILTARINDVARGLSCRIGTIVNYGGSGLISGATWLGSFFDDSLVITKQEIDMFPMFKNLDTTTLRTDFATWFDAINKNTVNTINTLLVDAKNKKCTTADSFNAEIMHPYTARYLGIEPSLSIDDINQTLITLPAKDYQDHLFTRVVADSLYRELVLPTVKK